MTPDQWAAIGTILDTTAWWVLRIGVLLPVGLVVARVATGGRSR